MIKNFAKYLQNIPNLPEIIIELDSFRKSKNRNFKQLAMIIKNDKNLHLDILKIMDFQIFDFFNKPKNIQNFISITSLEFVCALATSLCFCRSIKTNLFSYAVTFDDFLYSNTLSMLIVEMWLKNSDKKLKDELLIPAFLQDLAKPLISKAISEHKLTEQFLSEINNSNISKAEEKFIGFNSQRISSNILKNWGLSHNIIFPILFSKDLENCPNEFRLKALILNIVSIVSNLREPLLESNIKKAINEIELFGLNSDRFLTTISNINDNIKSNS